MYPLQADFSRRIAALHGDRGQRWLGQLPSIIADCAERWSLEVMDPFQPLSYSYAAPVIRADGSEAVLKIEVPGREVRTEIEALRLFDGRGAVRLLNADREEGTLLLERAKPGRVLSELACDEEEISAAVGVMGRLWRSVPTGHAFPTVADWGTGFGRMRTQFSGGTGPFHSILVQTAESLFAELVESMAEPVLLHGDLHHGNILSASREPWLAVDPKGVVGEPCYEVGALLRNPIDQLLEKPGAGSVLVRRADQLAAELGFERRRVVDWGLAQAVLSAWWSYEEQDGHWERGMACAELLATCR